MFLYSARTRKILYFITVVLLMILTVAFCWFTNTKKIVITSDWTIKGLDVNSKNGYISVEWDNINASNLENIQIDVKNDQDETVLTQMCSAVDTRYNFSDGTHGTAYKFCVNLILSDGQVIKSPVSRAVFLDYSSMEGLYFVNINTADGKNPTYNTISAPSDCWGQSITDNEYCIAEMSILKGDNTVFLGDIEIRVRGNTSAYPEKKPYKIKLGSAVNMLDLQDTQYAIKEWLLLPVFNFRFILGTEVAKLCGMEWQPRYSIVNFMLNGDYLGSYFIVEEIDAGITRCNIDETGYIIECDAYWWNSDGEYFRIDNQVEQVAFTFKYPAFDKIDQNKINLIKNHLNDGISYLCNNDPRYNMYIDIESWASWLLTHDILGTWDSGGSNMYYYKEDFLSSNTVNTKIKMGPAWDFDSMFMVDNWSRIRTAEHGYFPQLLQQSDFVNAYNEKWEIISGTLVQNISNTINMFFEQHRAGIDHSLYLDSVRWQKEKLIIDDNINGYYDLLGERIVWISEHI